MSENTVREEWMDCSICWSMKVNDWEEYRSEAQYQIWWCSVISWLLWWWTGVSWMLLGKFVIGWSLPADWGVSCTAFVILAFKSLVESTRPIHIQHSSPLLPISTRIHTCLAAWIRARSRLPPRASPCKRNHSQLPPEDPLVHSKKAQIH